VLPPIQGPWQAISEWRGQMILEGPAKFLPLSVEVLQVWNLKCLMKCATEGTCAEPLGLYVQEGPWR
jgi:hypothetical protein